MANNYTQPDKSNHEDQPADWLASSLLLTRAVSFILKPNEGVVVNVTGDANQGMLKDIKKVIVYNGTDGMVHVIECYDERLEEGQMISIHDGESKD